LTVPTLPELVEVFGSEAEPNGVLIVLFIPSKDKDGNDLSNQEMWADAASDLLSALFGGATIMPPAKGKWLNEETDQIITEPVVLIHCYARPSHASDEDRLKRLAGFLHRMGKETNQGEVAIVIDNVFHRIRKFTLAQSTQRPIRRRPRRE
jgi:hypothetical protein